jgi:hypothetical protein
VINPVSSRPSFAGYVTASTPGEPLRDGASFQELAARAAQGSEPVAYVDNNAWEPGRAGIERMAPTAWDGKDTGRNDGTEVLAALTQDDWDLVSASVGYKVGPGVLTTNPGIQPWLAYEIAFKRQDGKIADGQPVSTDWLRAWTGPGQAMDSDQLANALRWLDAGKPTDAWGEHLRARLNLLA